MGIGIGRHERCCSEAVESKIRLGGGLGRGGAELERSGDGISWGDLVGWLVGEVLYRGPCCWNEAGQNDNIIRYCFFLFSVSWFLFFPRHSRYEIYHVSYFESKLRPWLGVPVRKTYRNANTYYVLHTIYA